MSKPKPVICSEIPLPASLDSVFKEENMVLESDELKVMCNDFASNYFLTPEECTSIEKANRQQHNSLTLQIYWVRGFTASKVYDVLRTSKTKSAQSLIAQIYKTSRPVYAASVQWGVTNNSVALIMYDGAQREFYANYERFFEWICCAKDPFTHGWVTG